jgi:hypothetical protein
MHAVCTIRLIGDYAEIRNTDFGVRLGVKPAA